MRKIPRSLAFDMLFGSNRGDPHAVLDEIYAGFEIGTCGDCVYENIVAMVGTCCNNELSIGYGCKTDTGDGCNKFERKTS